MEMRLGRSSPLEFWINEFHPAPTCKQSMCARGRRMVSHTESDQEKRNHLCTFKPNTILGWLLEVPLMSIFESLEPPSLLGRDPFVLLPLQPGVVLLLSFLTSLYTRVTTSIVPAAYRRPRTRRGTRRISVTMVTLTGGSPICFVTLPAIVFAAVAPVALGIGSGIIPAVVGA